MGFFVLAGLSLVAGLIALIMIPEEKWKGGGSDNFRARYWKVYGAVPLLLVLVGLVSNQHTSSPQMTYTHASAPSPSPVAAPVPPVDEDTLLMSASMKQDDFVLSCPMPGGDVYIAKSSAIGHYLVKKLENYDTKSTDLIRLSPGTSEDSACVGFTSSSELKDSDYYELKSTHGNSINGGCYGKSSGRSHIIRIRVDRNTLMPTYVLFDDTGQFSSSRNIEQKGTSPCISASFDRLKQDAKSTAEALVAEKQRARDKREEQIKSRKI